ncbi:uncharacterized protein LOC143544487 [Bidens hawaiensis]|uniref:uncharacterized protein LOC143544487 n=1 Tax=Bidens hawaiensis TaxID=980011 RepID=UPI00404A6FD8
MSANDDDSLKKKKQKQGTLDEFVTKTKREDASSSTHSNNDLNNQTQETEMDTMSDSDDSTDLQSLGNEGPFARIFLGQFDCLMALTSYLSIKQERHPLAAPLLCIRLLLNQGVEIRGDVVALLELLSSYDENINDDIIKKIPLIERDMIRTCSNETTKPIVKDIGGDYFAILVDTYSGYEDNYPIVMCVRYVDKTGDVIERFLGIMNVMEDRTDSSLKNAVYALLEKHSLSPFNIRGQGYNGVSNLFGDFSGLRTLIKKETQSAYHVHCFVNNLELTLAEVTQQKNKHVIWLFIYLEDLLNMVLVSFKENGMLKESQFEKVTQAFEELKIENNYSLLHKVKCWEPYKLVLYFIEFYPVILDIIDEVVNETPFSPLHYDRIGYSHLRRDTYDTIENFDFVFSAHLMKTLFEVTNELSIVLQKKDENIVAAMSLVKLVKERLQIIRDEGWETLLSSVVLFCNKNDIKVLNMEDMRAPRFKGRRKEPTKTNLHHYQVDVFYAVIDLHLQELNSRFDDVVMELLVCMGSLSPVDSFCSFDKQKLVRLAELYPNEFSSADLCHLNDQLNNYINDVRKDERFNGLKDVKELSKKLVEVKKHEAYNLVYLLIKLVLILPVAAASVERAFSGLGFVKKELKNKFSDELLNDRSVTFIESEVLCKIHNDDIINSFESMKTPQE